MFVDRSQGGRVDPACRPRRVLRLGRATRRPTAARPAGDRRRRGGAGGQLRGQGARRPRRDGRRAGPRAVPRRDRGASRGCRRTPRPARTSSRCSAAPPRWSRGCPSTRRSSTSAGSAGCPGRPTEIAVRLRREVLEQGRPADHRRGGQDEVPGQGRQRRGQTGRPAGGAPRHRTRLPASAAGAAALGGRPDEHREAARARHLHRRPGRRAGRGRAGLDPGPGVRPAPARAGPQPRSAAGQGRPPAAVDRLAARHGPVAAPAVATSTPWSWGWSTGSPAGCGTRTAPGARSCCGCASTTSPGSPGRTRCSGPPRRRDHPGDGPRTDRGRDADDREPGPDAGRYRGRQSGRRRARCSSSCRSTSATGRRAGRRLDGVRERFGSAAVTRAVLMGRRQSIEMPVLPD